MKLVWLAWLLACLVVPLGAYVRLSQAGLGCPDWPGCYGQITPHHAAQDIARAELQAPDGPVSAGKAWREMIHRYLASTLGLVIVLLVIQCGYQHQQRLVALCLLCGVLLQGGLGMLTVTLRLKPMIVSAHLVFGMLLAAGLAVLTWRARLARVEAPMLVRRLCQGVFGLLLVQILLGGWVSANSAALACQGFPTCNGAWWPPLHFEQILPSLGAALAPLDDTTLITLHWLHRLGALLLSLALWILVWRGWPLPPLRRSLLCLGLAWCVQVSLGVANVLLQLPLALAVLHNLGALLLLSLTWLLLHRVRRKTS